MEEGASVSECLNSFNEFISVEEVASYKVAPQ